MSKNNVHPDHYKVAGRDRQDDAAAARQAMAVKAKTSLQQRPDRMPKAGPGPAVPVKPAPRPLSKKKKKK